MPIAKFYSLCCARTRFIGMGEALKLLILLGVLGLTSCTSHRPDGGEQPFSRYASKVSLRSDPVARSTPLNASFDSSIEGLPVERGHSPLLPSFFYLLTLGVGVGVGLIAASRGLPRWGRQQASRLSFFNPQNPDCLYAVRSQHSTNMLESMLLDPFPDLMIRMHRDGTYLEVKPTTAFPCWFPNLNVGENICNILPPEEAHRRLAATANALETGQMQVYEFPLWVEGQHLWQEARIMPLNQDEVLVVIRDLTQRRQMEVALRDSEARLTMAQRVAQVGYWEFDLEDQKIAWSDLMFVQWGMQPTEPEPTLEELCDRLHPDDVARFRHGWEQAIANGIPYTLDLRVTYPDGSIRYLDSRAEPILNEQGQIIKLIGTSVDITERKWTEEALRQSEERFRQIAETVQEGFLSTKSNQGCIPIPILPMPRCGERRIS